MKKILIFMSVLCTVISMVSCGKKDVSKANVPLVEVTEVKDINESGVTTFTGKTKSASEVNLAFRVAGQIQRLLVKEGDYVRKGQVVAEMDNRDYQVQLAATQAEYEQVKADAERVMALYAEGNTTASNNDKARYGLQQITQKLENHKNQLADTRLKSTIDGYVQTKFHEAGETVGAGMPIVSVFGSGNIEVEINISASDYANIEKFTNFYCKFDVTGSTSYPLTIDRISKEANTSQLYAVRLKFSETFDRKRITPGMTTMIYAERIGDASGVVIVPASAVLNANEQTSVFVYDEASTTVQARPVRVVSILRDGTMQVEGGLKSGDKVVTSGIHHIQNGQKVSVLQKPSVSNVGGLL